MMNSPQSQKILQQFSLRKTNCRNATLDLLLSRQFALSHSDIEEQIGENYDRVTIYRTLRTFLDKGIIHKVLDDSGNPKYALCSSEECSQEEHKHQHVHFKCLKCENTLCLNEVRIPEVQLPEGFQPIESNLLIQGVCVDCQ